MKANTSITNAHIDTTLPTVVCIVGPTATGKTELSQKIALQINGEVISADSMQIYKYMDIGTGKIKKDEAVVKHYGIDLISPGENYSVALFQNYARNIIKHISMQNKIPIICGGTGFYVRSVIDDFVFPTGSQTNNLTRDTFQQYLEKYGAEELWRLLESKDPAAANVIHPNNSKRVVRALELNAEGKSYAEQAKNFTNIKQLYPAIIVGLCAKPTLQKQLIDMRVNKMIKDGLVDEVKSLIDSGFRFSLTAMQAIGYKELVDYFDGRCTLDEAISRIKTSTHQYAKRQRSWFKRDDRIVWFDIENPHYTNNVIEYILSQLNNAKS